MGIAFDLRHAILFLGRAPAFTVSAIVSLALGIGVNTTMFSIVNKALLKPLVPRNSGDLVRIGDPQQRWLIATRVERRVHLSAREGLVIR